jgi:DNA-binding NarL/FixJ family response regulator
MRCKIGHVECPAEHGRKSVAHTVMAMALAQGTSRADDADAARDAWKGLIAGHWALVEQIDSGGKRFLIARKNDPNALARFALAPHERQVLAARARGQSLKLIAYELGLSIATVSKSMKAGMTKLGLSCEAEIVALFAPSTPGPSTTTTARS